MSIDLLGNPVELLKSLWLNLLKTQLVPAIHLDIKALHPHNGKKKIGHTNCITHIKVIFFILSCE